MPVISAEASPKYSPTTPPNSEATPKEAASTSKNKPINLLFAIGFWLISTFKPIVYVILSLKSNNKLNP
jgi:hypothetical protein